MKDLATLIGAAVRDNAGTRGEIVAASMPWVRIGWVQDDSPFLRMESFLRSDPRLSSIQILTITEGWIPAGNLVGSVSYAEEPLSEDLQSLLGEAKKKKSGGGKQRNPFKYSSKLGPAIRGRTFGKTSYWDCKGSGYRYTCKGKDGEKKVIKRKKEDKAKYQKAYKQWRKARKKAASPNKKGKK